jgi:hypothetical protein
VNLNQIGLFPSVVQEINENPDVKNFICSSAYFVPLLNSLEKFLQPVLNPVNGRKLEQRYVGNFSDVPHGCGGKPFLIFAPLTENGNAVQHTRIAYLPLFSNVNAVSIFFPDSIVNPKYIKQMRQEPYGFKEDFDHYEIPIVLDNFIKNPKHFLLIDEIQQRINQ